MRDDVQKETNAKLAGTTEKNLNQNTDIAGFRHDFLEANGFDVEGIDYDADVNPSSLGS